MRGSPIVRTYIAGQRRTRAFVPVLALALWLTVFWTVAAGAQDEAAGGSEEQQVSLVRRVTSSPQYRWGMTFLNFGIICFLFYRYARKPLLNFLDAQAREVAETLERSKTAKEQAKAELQDAIRKLSGVEEEKKRIIDLATEISENQRAKILDGAQQAADRVAEQLRADTERAQELVRKRALGLLANEVVDEAEKHIAKAITPEDQAALIDSFIERLDKRMVT